MRTAFVAVVVGLCLACGENPGAGGSGGGAGGGDGNGAVTTAPAVPVGLQALAGDALVQLRWKPNVEADLHAYGIHWGISPFKMGHLLVVPATDHTFAVTGLTNGEQVYFALDARARSGLISEVSAPVAAMPTATDPTVPELFWSIPANLATHVDVGTVLVMRFSEPMARETMQVRVTPFIALERARWTWDDTTLTLFHPRPLAWETTYTVTVDGEDLYGNRLVEPTRFSFTTRSQPDLTPPFIVGTVPVDGATGVALTPKVAVTFSEPMGEAAIALTPQVAFRDAECDMARTTCTWDLAGGTLAYGTEYTVKVTGRDVARNPLAGHSTFSFKTVLPPDTTPPTVVWVHPCDGAWLVPGDTTLTVRFSEAMNRPATERAFAVTAPAGVNGTFAWNPAGTTLTFDPAASFPALKVVRWEVGTGATDLAGNAMAARFSAHFTVACH